MFASTPRLLSNKENSLAHLPITINPNPSTNQKHRISGIGRAPRRPQSHIHGGKPYTRLPSGSIQRAKEKASNTKSVKGKRPPTLRLVETNSKVTQPKAVQREKRIARIPLKLPFPTFPPVPDLYVKGTEGIPAEYILPRLTPHLPSLLVVSSLYRPYLPQTTSVNGTPLAETSTNTPPRQRSVSGSASSTTPSTGITDGEMRMDFVIPALLDNSSKQGAKADSEKESLKAKIRGREPDVCLGIMRKGGNRQGEPMRLVPVNHMVYATQCAYWPSITSPTTPTLTTTPAPTATSSTSSTYLSSGENAYPTPVLETIAENPNSDEEDSDPDQSFSSSSDESFNSSASDATVVPNLATTQNSNSHIRQLPIIQLPLPSPETFNILHQALHLPTRSSLHDLLSIPSKINVNSKHELMGYLGKLSTLELMKCLETIHGVWKNFCVLGVKTQKCWNEMGEAWASVVEVLAGRAGSLTNQNKDGMEVDK